MRIQIRFIQMIMALWALSIAPGCRKTASLPLVSKTLLQEAGPTFAVLQARVYVDGGATITKQGACWMLKTGSEDSSTVRFPTISNDTSNITPATGVLNIRIENLLPDTAYYACFFSINKEGVKYSYPVLFRTPAIPEGAVFVEGFWAAGTGFEMGNTAGAADEQPVHLVQLNNYFISGDEITNQQYCRFLNYLDSTGNMTPDGTSGSNKFIDIGNPAVYIGLNGTTFTPVPGYESFPVTGVSWYGAQSYCNWKGGNLPSEAQWEFAATGGLLSKSFTYAGSNDPNTVAWYTGNANGISHATGGKVSNELGLYDMTGNATEWCLDWYAPGYYSVSSYQNPLGPSSGSGKVIRGGAYDMDAITNTARSSLAPGSTNPDVGFRVAYYP